MLATRESLRASADARRRHIGAVLGTHPRVRFAYLCGAGSVTDAAGPGGPFVALYVDPMADADATGREVESRLAGGADTASVGVAVLNAMDAEEAGRLLRSADLLLDRDRVARVDYEVAASSVYADFHDHELLFLRERAERPSGDTVARLLAALDLRIGRLKTFDGLSVEEYDRDWMTASAVKRELEVAILLCVDLARHTLAERRLRVPATYRGVLAAARDAGLVEADLAGALTMLCGLRSRLAHEGHRVEPAAVVAALATGVNEIARFRDVAARW